MANKIQLLPDHVANQIAAGEVIQRPASVVKELLENAIDAQATHIQLHIKEAGKTLIQVIDNGTGMLTTYLRLAFERHATSKIEKLKICFNCLPKDFAGKPWPPLQPLRMWMLLVELPKMNWLPNSLLKGVR